MPKVQRLKRLFANDIETYRSCGRKLRVIASIEEPAVIERILVHLGGDGESFDQAHPRQAKRRGRHSRAPPESDLLTGTNVRERAGSGSSEDGPAFPAPAPIPSTTTATASRMARRRRTCRSPLMRLRAPSARSGTTAGRHAAQLSRLQSPEQHSGQRSLPDRERQDPTRRNDRPVSRLSHEFAVGRSQRRLTRSGPLLSGIARDRVSPSGLGRQPRRPTPPRRA